MARKATVGQSIVVVWFFASLLAILCVIPALGMAFIDNPNREKHSVDATLIDAYPYSYSTGKYSSAMGWKGKFELVDKRTIDQDIDGFFYKNFVNGGEKPIKSWVSVSNWQLGHPDPKWVDWRDTLFGIAVLGLLSMILCTLGFAIVED